MSFKSFKSYGNPSFKRKNQVNPIVVAPVPIQPTDVLDYNFRIKGNSATTPITDFDGRLQLTNTGNVAMINDSIRGYVFQFTGSNFINVNFQNPQIFSRTFWVSTNHPEINTGCVFSTFMLYILPEMRN